MADWRDENGIRKLKGFKTQRSAVTFQNRMRELGSQIKSPRLGSLKKLAEAWRETQDRKRSGWTVANEFAAGPGTSRSTS
jgi:hypothetical protein